MRRWYRGVGGEGCLAIIALVDKSDSGGGDEEVLR